jgi:hypothetical protein
MQLMDGLDLHEKGSRTMRGMMLAVLMAFVAGSALAGGGDNAIGNETPTADKAEEPEEFKVPAGFLAKKRGKKVVYCKKSLESGTRFAQEKCYSEEQLRAIEMAREQDQATFDQTRKICSNLEACGGG